MAHFCFGFPIDFAERHSPRRIEKNRILAKAATTLWSKSDASFAGLVHSPCLHARRLRPTKRQDTNEPRGAFFIWNLLEYSEKLVIVFLIVSSLTTVTGRINARRSVQRIHLQA